MSGSAAEVLDPEAATSRRFKAAARPSLRAGVVPFRRGLIGIAVVVVIAEVVTRMGIVNQAFLPPFSEMVVAAGRLLARPDFLGAVAETLGLWATSLGIVILVGVVLGFVLAMSDLVFRITRSLIELVRPVPAIALIPLLILLFGRGVETTLIVAVYAAVWPVLFNTITGVHDVAPQAKEMARSFRLSGAQTIGRVVVPSAAPFIVIGIRLASTICLISVITVELIAGGSGMGAFILAMQQAGGSNVVFVYGAVLLTGVLGLLLNAFMELFERRFFAWQRQTGGD